MKTVLFLFAVVTALTHSGLAQTATPYDPIQIKSLIDLANELQIRYQLSHQMAVSLAQQKNWPIWRESSDGKLIGLAVLTPNGRPLYFLSQNLNAAKTVGTDKVWPGGSAGLNLTGFGMLIGEWDGGRVRASHQELVNRVSQRDSPAYTNSHSTHVAGTLIATGVVASARGMAYQAKLHAYDWEEDDAEMATAAATGLLFSNHSYGFITGWEYDFFNDGRWAWFGDPAISENEDYSFGFYSSSVRIWDQIAFSAPFYLIVKAAGNDRNDNGPGTGESHWVYNGTDWVLSYRTRKPDGDYDCLEGRSNSKNILTVGAVADISAGYSRPSDVVMSSFSAWGPTDDGRIKPDIVANGIGLYSCTASSNSSYASYSGTSMSSPNACGSLALLQQHYQNLHNGQSMRAATLKALAIHSADEAGLSAGPDYQYGWGLLNSAKAAELITDAGTHYLILEETLSQGSSYSLQIQADGTAPLVATIAWTDPPGTPVEPALDPSDKMLVNDLDLRITGTGSTFQPWILNPAQPGAAAKTGDNTSDNVEQVAISTPAPGLYTLTVTHKGVLQGGQQAFALIVGRIGTARGQIALTAPNGGEIWSCGSQTITWTSANTSGAVKIEYSADAGATWQVLAESAPDNGAFEWVIQPALQSGQCQVRISDAADPSLTDLSDGLFSVDCPPPPCLLKLIVPNAGVAWQPGSRHSIAWTPAGLSGTVTIDFSSDNGASWSPIATSPDLGCYDWQIPDLSTSQARIRISDVSLPSCSDTSDSAFTIGTPTGSLIQITDISGDYGTEVVAAIEISANPSPIDAFGLELFFNPAHLSWIQVEKAGLTSDWLQLSGQEIGPGQLKIGGYHPSAIPVASTGTLLNVRFRVVVQEDTCAASHLTFGTLYDDIIDLKPVAGTFSARSACVLGDVNMNNAITPADALCAFQIYLSNGVPSPDCASPCALIAADANCDGQITPADALEIFYHYLSGEPLQCPGLAKSGRSAQPGSILLADVTGGAGSTVWVPLQVANGSGISAFGLDLGYPADRMRFVGVQRAQATKDWLALSGLESEPGRLRVGGFHSTPMQSSGETILALLGFEIKAPVTGARFNVIAGADDLALTAAAAEAQTDALPSGFGLAQSYPNPFNAGTEIRFWLPHAAKVRLTVYNISGQKIRTLVAAPRAGGHHSVRWDGRDDQGHELSSGVYLYQIVAGDFTDQKQMILVK